MTDTSGAVRREIDLPVPPDDVWDAIVDDDERATWFGGPTTLEPRPGGGGSFEEADGTRRTATVDDIEPGRRLSWTWSTDDDAGDASRVEIVLLPTPGGTHLVVTETRLVPAARLSALSCSGGPLVGLELHLLLRTPSLTVRG